MMSASQFTVPSLPTLHCLKDSLGNRMLFCTCHHFSGSHPDYIVSPHSILMIFCCFPFVFIHSGHGAILFCPLKLPFTASTGLNWSVWRKKMVNHCSCWTSVAISPRVLPWPESAVTKDRCSTTPRSCRWQLQIHSNKKICLYNYCFTSLNVYLGIQC